MKSNLRGWAIALFATFTVACGGDSLVSTTGEIGLALCDRGRSCGCQGLDGGDLVIDFGTPRPGAQSTRRVLRLLNTNSPRSLRLSEIGLLGSAGVFQVAGVRVLDAPSEDNPGDVLEAVSVVGEDGEERRVYRDGRVVASYYGASVPLPLELNGAQWAEIDLDFWPSGPVAPGLQNPGSLPPSGVPAVSAAGEHTAELTLISNSAQRPRATVALRAGGGSSQVCVGGGACGGPGLGIDFGTFDRSDIARDAGSPIGLPVAQGGVHTITVRNTGAGEVPVSVELTDDGIAETRAGELLGERGVFFIGALGCKVVAAGETLEIPVEYRPSIAGEHRGEVVVAGLGEPVHIELTGRITGARLCAKVEDDTPDDLHLQFGVDDSGRNGPGGRVAANVDETRRVWASNCGFGANLQVLSAEFDARGSYAFESTALPQYGVTLLPADEIEIPVSFTPSLMNVGEIIASGAVVFSTDDMTEPQVQVALDAAVGAPEQCVLIATPDPVDFGWVAEDEMAVGTACPPGFNVPGCQDMVSRLQNVVFSNIGKRPCYGVTPMAVVPDQRSAGMFQYFPVDQPPSPFDLHPGEQSPPIDLVFKREASPTRNSHFAKISVIHNDDYAGREIFLEAEGGGSPNCTVEFRPTVAGGFMCPSGKFDFGSVNIGQTQTAALQVLNVGSRDCNVSSVQVSGSAVGTFSHAGGDLPGLIPSGEFRTVEVTFRPRPQSGSAGIFADLPFLCGDNVMDMVVDSGPGGSFITESVALTGLGTTPDIDVIPSHLDFGEVTVGCCSAWRRIAIYNSGDGTLQVNAVRMLGNSDPGFAVDSGGFYTLTPGTDAQFRARFCAGRSGPHNGVVQIDSTDNDERVFAIHVSGEGTTSAEGKDSFVQSLRPEVDVLWAIDDSGSMSEEQDSVGRNFDSFVSAATALDTDYHIGVVNTDADSDEAGKLYACGGSPLWISSSQSEAEQRAQFACNARVSDSGRPSSDEREAPLEAARKALDYPNLDGFNAGFLRPSAKLFVIAVTDEEDQSGGSPQLYVDYFRNLKGIGNPELLDISAIAGPPPDGCDTAEANEFDHQAVTLTGGEFRSICSADWTDLISVMGLDVFNARRQFPLSRPAVESSLAVTLCDGGRAGASCRSIAVGSTDGFLYDSELGSVTLSGNAVPGPGSLLEIEYRAACFQ